ncbi:MAG: DUF4340 domain-containing protein [Proteobacteria bacterium]|nr:DUF4340 domain-containing protein [Pseudomonadota bacterium]
MSPKKLVILIAVAILALVAAWFINSSNAPQTGVSAQAQTVLPELHAHINDVNAITLTGAGDKVLATLKRGADGWSIAEKSGYPADLAKVREFLIKLDQATLTEQKTSNPKLYAELGVDDVKDAKATGVRVTLGGLAKPLSIIIGNYNGAGGGGTFVRREGDAQSWLAAGNLTVAKTEADWEQRTLADIASSRLRSVTLTNPDGKTLKVYKDAQGDANFKVADVPKGREAASEFVANELGSALSGLNADDVFAAKDMAPPDKAWKDEYAAFDGLVVAATGWEQSGKDYAQFSARLDETAANAFIDAEQAKAKSDYDAAVQAAANKVESEKSTTGAQAKANAQAASDVAKPLAVSDAARDRSDRIAALNKEVASLNKTFAGWTFALPAYKFTDMSKSMDDMLKPLPEKKTDSKKPAPRAGK